MKINHKQIADLSTELVKGNPADWTAFLFRLQNSLIAYGHLEAMPKDAAEEFAYRFSELHGFFEGLAQIKKC